MDNRCKNKHYFENIKAFSDLLGKKELLNTSATSRLTPDIASWPC